MIESSPASPAGADVVLTCFASTPLVSEDPDDLRRIRIRSQEWFAGDGRHA